MDIKFSTVQVVLFLAALTLVVGTTSAGHRSRGSGRVAPKRQNRREVRDYLAPPSQDASYTNYGPPSLQPTPLIPYRPGRLVNPAPSTEAPGYFSRLASWLNPFGGSPTPPPLPEIIIPKYGQPYAPAQSYGPPLPPPSQSYGPPLPQPPPAGPNGYLPPKGKGKNCNPCNIVPWIPMQGVVQKDTYASGTANVANQPSVNQEAKNHGGPPSSGYVEEVRTPDFSYGLPVSSQPGHNPFSPVPSSHGYPPSAPIPYPHLYPGPMPPLFKSKPFNSPSEGFHPTPSIQLESGPSDHIGDSILTVPGSGHSGLDDGHVEVLPPGAEVDTSGLDFVSPSGYIGEIRDTLPPGYEESHHLNGHGSTSFKVEQSANIHEEHLSTQLTAGYEIQTPPATVEVIKSVPAADYSASVDHPIHFEQSPLIDLSQGNQKGSEESAKDYAVGLNPPNESADIYNSNPENGGGSDQSKEVQTSGEIPKNSYGDPVGLEPPKDSLSDSTVTNGTFSYPTSSYGIPDVGGLPISHETTKPAAYENYPPSTEKFLISVNDPIENSKAPSSDDSHNLKGSLQDLRDDRQQQGNDQPSHGQIVDSYQHHIDQTVSPNDHQNGQSGFLQVPEPLVPYRPSSLYVPYPPYTGPSSQQNEPSSSLAPGPTTEEPFLQALLKSYNNFKQEMDAKDQLVREQQERIRAVSQNNQPPSNFASPGGTTWVSQPQPSFSSPEQINPSVYISGNMMPPPVPVSDKKQQQSGGKKNKQVQIIIPYTSQYTPSPFQPVADDWSGRGPLEQTQARKVPIPEVDDHNYVGQESQNVEVTRPLRPLQNLLIKEVAKKPPVKQTNNSIDVLKLQKNIDNWTIQEYSRGITSSTALPSSSHPYLLPSKKIPHEYLNKNQSAVSEERIDTNRPDLPGFNYNDLEHEGSASSRIDVPHIQVLRIEGVSKPVKEETRSSATISSTEATTSSSSTPSSSSIPPTTSTTTQASWADLSVSISPHNNERVYVVTPQPVRSPKSWSDLNDSDKSGKFEAIERAYQVLPQAVNNLASASVSGPEDSPLWGIMEHDQYARNDQGNSSTSAPILYSGHSKVSNARLH